MVREPDVDSAIFLPDGRSIAYADFGPRDGRALVYLHGHPGSRLDLGRDDLLAPLAEAGYRLIAFDRPGWGGSEFTPGRTHADWAEDLEHAVDHLELKRFALLAYSRGGVFGLACAARLADRLDGVCLLSPVAPGEMPGWAKSWRADIRMGFAINRRAPALGRALTKALGRTMRDEEGAVKGVSRHLRSPADVQLMRANPDWCLRAAQEANRQGPAAWVEDAKRLLDWPLGFSLGDVDIPVAIIHGDADRLVPISHSRFLIERLPQAQLEEIPGYGHAPTPEALASVASRLVAAMRSPPQ
jgi:pimeloyl-ACP methyl ester carboxylesterase